MFNRLWLLDIAVEDRPLKSPSFDIIDNVSGPNYDKTISMRKALHFINCSAHHFFIKQKESLFQNYNKSFEGCMNFDACIYLVFFSVLVKLVIIGKPGFDSQCFFKTFHTSGRGAIDFQD